MGTAGLTGISKRTISKAHLNHPSSSTPIFWNFSCRFLALGSDAWPSHQLKHFTCRTPHKAGPYRAHHQVCQTFFNLTPPATALLPKLQGDLARCHTPLVYTAHGQNMSRPSKEHALGASNEETALDAPRLSSRKALLLTPLRPVNYLETISTSKKIQTSFF